VLSTPSDVDPTPLFTTYLQRADGDVQLAAALAGKKIPADTAKLGLRAVLSAMHNDSPLAVALTTAGGVDAQPKELTKEEMAALMAEVPKSGDPARGEKVFRAPSLPACNAIRLAAPVGRWGPDMVSLGASAPPRLHHRFGVAPQQGGQGRFRLGDREDQDGDIITGIKIKQTDKELDPAGRDARCNRHRAEQCEEPEGWRIDHAIWPGRSADAR